ncbi:MAG TPA: PadR family transcriptional regulator [Streptosporangiaceae bacterium]|nr:PadR family transcriptional regulator [Streptosporangiaceae bacterium]
MTGRQFTPFEHILLGLICAAPSSGYDLKRIFATTPMGLYQPSSGTLYPALRRLEQRGLVKAQSPAGQDGRSARHRRVYQPTQTGRAAHLDWLRTPVAPATVSPDLGLHLMRFVMMEHLLPPEEVLTFLRSLADALAALIAQLERHTAAADFADRHPPLALDHGVAIHRASLRWAEHTIAALSAASRATAPGGNAGPLPAGFREGAVSCGGSGI